MSFKLKDLKIVYGIGRTLRSETEEMGIFPFDKLKIDSRALNPTMYVGVKNNPNILLVVEGVVSENKKTNGVSIRPVILQMLMKKCVCGESGVCMERLKAKIEKPSTNEVTKPEEELYGLNEIGDRLLYKANLYSDRLLGNEADYGVAEDNISSSEDYSNE